MYLDFLNRTEELARLRKRFSSRTSTLVCLYGRRQCGKSRLLLKALEGVASVYYVGDEREAILQRRALAKEVSRLVEGFNRVEYPGWEELLERWFSDAPKGAVLAIDELPALCSSSPELPGILQKLIDKVKRVGKPVHLAICGSSQRMMMGLTLNSTAPLYGRADEIIKVRPLLPHYLYATGKFTSPSKALEAYCVWGGIPRYWELALEYPDTVSAVRELVLSPMGVLHQEPGRLLLDELRDTRQGLSLLTLIGQGCSRLSEIAGRIGKPATSLARPMAALVDMDFVRRDIPFDCSPRDSKRSLYRINDPLFDFWFTFVEPHISLLDASRYTPVEEMMKKHWSVYVGKWWEEIARWSVATLMIDGDAWLPASRWWGRGNAGEIDIVSRSVHRKEALLIGEAKVSVKQSEIGRIFTDLERKGSLIAGTEKCMMSTVLFVMDDAWHGRMHGIITPRDIIDGSVAGK